MKLRDSVPKYGGSGRHREVSSADTLERIRPHLRRMGVTRVADITGLDRVGIPVWNAIIPRSHDTLSVYNGKGATTTDAQVSAVMEAAERFSAWQPMRPDVIAPYPELRDSGVAVMDPRSHAMEPRHGFDITHPLSWVRGWDLIGDEWVHVPMCLAGYYVRFHELPCYHTITSNGIASGNSLEEAICHALMEVVERDAWTMADIASHRMKNLISKRGVTIGPGSLRWLEDLNPSVDLTTLPSVARNLAGRIVEAGISLVVRDITSGTQIPSFAAITKEDLGPQFSQGHIGYGTHPDAEIAVVRAITEVAQTRAVDIQGMREDLNLPGAEVGHWEKHSQRGAAEGLDAWPYGESEHPIAFSDVDTYPSDDVMDDVRLMLDRIRDQNLERVIVVDLSPPGIPVHVVRVIVPGLESYGVDQGVFGPRAKAHWDTTLAGLIQRRDASKGEDSGSASAGEQDS